MLRSARVLAPLVLISLVAAGLSVGASSAVAAPKPVTPNGPYTVTKVPTAHVKAPRMFAYAKSHFAAAAAALPDSLVTALQRDLKESPETYLADADAAARGVEVVAGLKSAGTDVLGSHMTGTVLTVNVASKADIAAVVATGATAVVGKPAPVVLKGVAKALSANVYPGEQYFSTFSGTNEVAICTIGFTGYKVTTATTPIDRPISAGHCAYQGSRFATHSYPFVLTAPGQYTDPSFELSPSGPSIATPTSASFGKGYDASVLTATSGTTETPDVATWGASSGGSTGTGAPNSTAPVTITGETQAMAGMTLCKSGSRTGWSCGTITSVDQTVDVEDDSGKVHTVNSIIATTCAQPGDSGGAAIVGTLALGITSSGSGTCGASGFYSGFFPLVASSSHASVEKQFGSKWELQVKLTAPVLTSPSPSNPTLHTSASLNGTVANASTGDYVGVFLDGATTTSRTAVVASNGTWTYPLTTVPGGAHSYVIETRYGTYSASSGISGTMTVIPKVTVTTPTISGSAVVGSTLTAKTTIVPSTATLTYQWESNGSDVGGNQSTYVPVASDLGNTITVSVGGSASGYDSSDMGNSAPTKAIVHGTLTTHKPVVSGNRNVGQTLTASVPPWSPAGVTLNYQWLRNSKKISGATDASYVQQPSDHGAKIDVTVTGTLTGYVNASATSTKTSTETKNPLFDSAPTPTIDNVTPSVKAVLTAIPGGWAPGDPTFTYQWRENGHSIAGATKSLYTIPTSYVGKAFSVTVTAHESGYTTTSVTSAPSAAAAAIPFTTQGTVAFAGLTPNVKGAVWKVTTSGWSPAPTFTYVWQSDGVTIPKATKSSYTLTTADVSTSMTVLVTPIRTGYHSDPILIEPR